MISRKAGHAISCCFLDSFKVSIKVVASLTVMAVKATMLIPRFFLPSPPRYTRIASGRSRAPLQAGHSSLWKIPTTPSPLHSGQAPYGELNEKRRGSTSGNDEPSIGQINLAERVRTAPSGLSILTSPFDSCRARSTASESRSCEPFGSSVNSLT